MSTMLRRMLSGVSGMVLLAALMLPLFATSAFAFNEMRRIDESYDLLRNIGAIPEQGIPAVLLRDAHGIMIIPHTTKIGFFLGARHGSGVLVVRDDKGEWSDPIFVRLAGGSLGWRLGSQSADLVLVFKSKASVAGILKGNLTTGVDFSVAAGPVGRSTEGASAVTLKSEINSYAHSRGVFAGTSLDDGVLTIDHDANGLFYGDRNLDAKKIVAGEGGKRTAAVTDLLQLLKEVSIPTTETAAATEP